MSIPLAAPADAAGHAAGPGVSGVPADPAAVDLPDVFLSYARENRLLAELLADSLGAQGLTVWWDSDLSAGVEFSAVIEAKLRGAAVVVVLWSADSVRSVFVRDECSRAMRHSKLLPVRIEDVELPLGFGQLHTLDLLAWEGDADDPAFEKLLQDVHARRQSAPYRASAPAPLAELTGFATHARRWRPHGTSLIAGVTLALAAGGFAIWYLQDRQDGQERAAVARVAERAEAQRRSDADKLQADRHFSEGLEQQYAAVPQLEKALNDYLSALELRPAHARAHFYLGHVYAQSGKPADALTQFKLALTSADAPLDRSQRQEADKQVLALAVIPQEQEAISRSAARAVRTPAAAPPGTPAPAPAPAAPPAHPPATAPAPTPAPATDVAASPAPVDASTTAMAGGVTLRSVRLPPAAPKSPPLTPAPEATLPALMASVEGLFDDNKDRRISATTSLVLDPQALSDAVPIAVPMAATKAVALARRGQASLDASASAGVINTLVLLQSALPGTLQVNRLAIAQLLDAAELLGDYTALQAGKVRELLKAAQLRNPVAYIQIANEAQRPIAQALAMRLRAFGYEAPGIELVGDRAPLRTELRVQGKSDRSYARWVAKVVAEVVGAQTSTSALRNAKPKTDTFEIWFDRQLCAPDGRQLAGCKPA